MSYQYISIKEFGGPEVLDLVTEERLPKPNKGGGQCAGNGKRNMESIL